MNNHRQPPLLAVVQPLQIDWEYELSDLIVTLAAAGIRATPQQVAALLDAGLRGAHCHPRTEDLREHNVAHGNARRLGIAAGHLRPDHDGAPPTEQDGTR